MPLSEFVREAWEIVEPGAEYRHNWHVDLICGRLTHLANTPHHKLLVNIPPGCMKSLLVSVFFPAWVWTWWPEARFLYASYGQELAVRDSMKCRMIIESDWYQARWPLRLASDANLKMYFINARTGWRLATAVVGRGTGEHPDFKIADDPHNVRQAESDVERQTALSWWDGTMATRGVARGARSAIVMQRLHEEDLSGHVLAAGGWEHVCLPMRFEPGRCGLDQRREAGELLWPSLFPEETVRQMELTLRARAAGQLQQRPTAPEGDLFRLEWFRVEKQAPTDRGLRAVRYWDKAGTKDGGDWTVGVLLVLSGGLVWVVDVVRGQWSARERELVLENTAALDRIRYPKCQTWIEQEPGSGGKESAENTIQRLAGFSVRADRVTGAKETRWEPWAAYLEAGNVRLVEGEWCQPFLSEHLLAPNGSHDDQIDAAAGAFAKLTIGKNVDLGAWADLM